MNSKRYLKLPIFCKDEVMEVEVKKNLFNCKSDFQEIMIAELEKFGKSLIIDGVMQCAESDHKIYDRELLKLFSHKDKKILILGGGDGFVAEEALRINPNLDVKIVDLDAEVVNSCKNFLGQKIFNNPKVQVYIEDVFYFLKITADKINGKINGIVCDLTDAPIGRHNKKEFENFYLDIVRLSFKKLSKGGWISVQAGASKNMPQYIDAVGIIRNILQKSFKKVQRSDVFIPSYGEDCAFLFGKKL